MRVLIIGGLGDHDFAMRLALPLWWRRGFRARVWPVGWTRDDGKFDERWDALLAHVDALPKHEKLYVIGTSAGGILAALLLLARPERVVKVIAVGSPLTRSEHSTNGLLNTALQRLQRALGYADKSIIARIGSYYAMADTTVKPAYSLLPGAYKEELPSSGHVRTIALALTIYNRRLVDWLKRA